MRVPRATGVMGQLSLVNQAIKKVFLKFQFLTVIFLKILAVAFFQKKS